MKHFKRAFKVGGSVHLAGPDYKDTRPFNTADWQTLIPALSTLLQSAEPRIPIIIITFAVIQSPIKHLIEFAINVSKGFAVMPQHIFCLFNKKP